jgi:hypothetical protein
VRSLNQAGVGVGEFAIQSSAEPPAKPGNLLGTLVSVPIGAAAGAVLGLAVVTGLLVARRPVIDGGDAEEATGVPSLGTVTVPRTRRGRFAAPSDFTGLVPACRRLLGLTVPTVVLVSRHRDQGLRQQLSVALTRVLTRVDSIRFVGPAELRAAITSPGSAGPADGGVDGSDGDVRLTLIDSGEPLDLLQPPRTSATVLVVPVGIGSTALSSAVVEHLGGSAQARLLLVQRGRRRRGAPLPGEETSSQPPSQRRPEAVAGAR